MYAIPFRKYKGKSGEMKWHKIMEIRKKRIICIMQ